ncbi:MAG: hypothetical protein MUE94_09830 [Verrucomicrobia bacterium]|nr:hypothetical protein [Verrucomicrobiota bacterium]
MPEEFTARLNDWRKRYDASCGCPLYLRRKDHDAEGRSIAAELHHAVCKNDIHVIFRHWEAFDFRHWRTLRREENLATGNCRALWLEEDLPEALASRVVRIFPDHGGTYLWDLDGAAVSAEGLGAAADLDARFETWSNRWSACVGTDRRGANLAELAAERFDDEGLALARELKGVVGETARVVYNCVLAKVDIEIRADDSSQEWPRGTNYRQQVLDEQIARRLG